MEQLISKLEFAPIIGVLEQIQKVNYMIDMHRLHEDDGMVREFERQRDNFLLELKKLLGLVRISADLKMAV
jgi:hypothetical protein